MKMNCTKCSQSLIRRGFQVDGTQRYFCKSCKRYCQAAYKYKAYQPGMNEQLTKWLKVGGTLRQTAKALGIAFNTFQKRTLFIAVVFKMVLGLKQKLIVRVSSLIISI